MSYKLGLLLSFPFLIFVFLYLGDLAILSIGKQELDSLAVTISYRISMEGRISEGTHALAGDCGANIVLHNTETPKIGDTVIFTLEKECHPLIMSNGPMTLRTSMTCVVGYYRQ